MKHDPPRDTAAYMGGTMSTRRSERFEAHLLECSDCWQELSEARSGRAIAESMRELAPQSLREDLRAAALRPARRAIHVGWLAGTAAALILLLLAGISLFRPEAGGDSISQQPEPIAQAIIDFQNRRIPAERPAQRPAPDLAGLGLAVSAAGSGAVGNVTVDGFAYVDRLGRRLQLYLSTTPFPEAAGARMMLEGPTSPWMASSQGISLLCAQKPFPLLALSDHPDVLEDLSAFLKVS